MRRFGLMAALAGLAAIPAGAEGRNDPFLRCLFEDGRQVVLAERGDAIDWIEEGVEAEATVTPDTERGLISVTALIHGRGAEFLTFVDGPAAEGAAAAGNRGEARLVSGVFLQDGKLTTRVTSGKCEEFFG